jgi:NADP-dependent 3-hydroxy acid dehydrogenase YdfG
VDEIFEINFFANVNIIKAILPVMRTRKNGHIIVITGISKFASSSSEVLLTTISWSHRNAWVGDVLFFPVGY